MEIVMFKVQNGNTLLFTLPAMAILNATMPALFKSAYNACIRNCQLKAQNKIINKSTISVFVYLYFIILICLNPNHVGEKYFLVVL